MNLLMLLATGAPTPATNIEDVFSAYTYTGNGSTQTITNGINLSGQGGLVWIKDRTLTAGHYLSDTIRGLEGGFLKSETTAAQSGSANPVTAYSSTGFSLAESFAVNTNNSTYSSWTFRKAAKFFDVVTYTGNSSNRTIAHSLGIAPGMIIIKRTNAVTDWKVYHRSLTSNAYYLVLNTTAAEVSDATMWNSTTADATTFSLGEHNDVNLNAATYVAYLFAHDTSATGLIQCGGYTGNGSATGPVITLGWEPQLILTKRTSNISQWSMTDNMRGLPVGASPAILYPSLSNAESDDGAVYKPTSTGFQLTTAAVGYNNSTDTYIYLAIRRGPMAQPTVGTQVYGPIGFTGNGSGGRVFTGVGFSPDLVIRAGRSNSESESEVFIDRLRGSTCVLYSTSTAAESTIADTAYALASFNMDGYTQNAANNLNVSTRTYIDQNFRRYPGVFDVVCYTGTGAAHTESHNLGVAPELMVVKRRASLGEWEVCPQIVGTGKRLRLNTTGAIADEVAGQFWNGAAPTATVFSVGTDADVNTASSTYVAYLFATLAGISKVGTYTGNGSNQTINCGFSAGARFVLIKRTDSTGDWFVWDSARGIVAADDPHLSLNTTVAEVTTDDTIDPDNSGFIINQLAATNVNVSTATYIYLAFA